MKQIRITSADIMDALGDPTIPDAYLRPEDKAFVAALSNPIKAPGPVLTYAGTMDEVKKGK